MRLALFKMKIAGGIIRSYACVCSQLLLIEFSPVEVEKVRKLAAKPILTANYATSQSSSYVVEWYFKLATRMDVG